MRLLLFLLFFTAGISLSAQVSVRSRMTQEKTDDDVKTGAERIDQWLPLTKDKKVAVVANHTSMINTTHLVDTMLSLGVKVVKIFSPEHGFRGQADDGEEVASSVDEKTKLPVISLYGNHRKPTAADLKGVDLVIYDIQDVGVRCYTFISTMTYVMEACAEQRKPFVVLDRPNPNGYYVDGPVMEKAYMSWVGLHAVPLVYGMTIAEYARMVNEEKWMAGSVKCDLSWVPCEGYDHNVQYQLPVRTSPNLPNMASVYLYPSLCLFEGTVMSVGRGTDMPYQVVGHPKLKNAAFTFTPSPHFGAKVPLYNGQVCYGHDLHEFADLYIRDYKGIYLFWIIGCYKDMPEKDKFFNSYFEKLAGTATLKKQIQDGVPEDKIRASWAPELVKFKAIRKKYLLYDDFE
jgi:uncharacterized protein YbbC (DUF1343 family)